MTPKELEFRSYELYKAASNGEFEHVKNWVMQGADVDRTWNDGWTALQIACEHYRGTSSDAVVEYLLEVRANPDFVDARGRTALFFAAKRGLTNIVKNLLAVSKNQLHTSDGHGVSALNHAVYGDHAEVVKHLLEARADPHQKCAHGGTAYKAAAKRGHPEIRKHFGHDEPAASPAPPAPPVAPPVEQEL